MSNDRGPGAGSRLPSGTDRQRYLSEVCGLLWPSPATVTLGGTVPGRTGTPGQRRGQEREFILLLGSSRPRLLIPAAAAPGAAAVRGYGEPGSAGARLGARALSLTLACGIGGAVLRRRIRVCAPAGADTIESFLRVALGADVLVSLYLGPARANRKPVLQLLSPQGQPAGFAKIGTSPLTRALVQAECDALIRLGRAGLSGVTVPEVLHFGEWRGLKVLVLSALPVRQRRRPVNGAALAAAMNSVACVGGLRREPLATGSYWPPLTAVPSATRCSARKTRCPRGPGTRSWCWAAGTGTGRRGTWRARAAACWCGTGSASPMAYRSASTRCTTGCRRTSCLGAASLGTRRQAVSR